MYTGSEKVKVTAPSIVIIKADAGFTAYGCVSGKPCYVLGPFNNSQLLRVTIDDSDIDTIEVKTANTTKWTLEFRRLSSGKEQPDTTPIELPIGAQRPPSIREEMQRYIRETLSSYMASTQESETFEEADDFDIGLEDEWTSPYELQDMQEDTPYTELEAEGEANAVNPIPTHHPEEKVSQEGAQAVKQELTPEPSPAEPKNDGV